MLDNADVHFNQVDEEYLTGGKKYLWTKRQEDIILPLARNRATATVILRELRRQDTADLRNYIEEKSAVSRVLYCVQHD